MRAREITIIIVGAVLACLGNWVYHYSEIADKAPAGLTVDVGPGLTDVDTYLAGWPSKYYVCVEYPEDLRFSSISILRLLGNIASWFACISALILYDRLALRLETRSQQKELEPDAVFGSESLMPAHTAQVEHARGGDHRDIPPRTRRRLSLRDLLVLMLVLAIGLSYRQILTSTHDKHAALAEAIRSRGGKAELSSFIPTVYERWLTESGKRFFNRITSVSLTSPTDAELREILDETQVRVLRISGDSYNLRMLDEIAANPFLRDVRVSGRIIDARFLATIGSAKQLQSINLDRTNVTARALDILGAMPALNRLNLVNTDVVLDKEIVPVWGDSLKSLTLPRPARGRSCQFVIHGWKYLEEVTCCEYDERKNVEPVRLSLSDLPKLTTVLVDPLQLYDLELVNLPQLDSFGFLEWQVLERVSSDESVPSASWIRRFKASDTPALRFIDLYCENLESLEIGPNGPDTISLLFSNESHVFLGTSFIPNVGPVGLPPEAQVSLKRRQSWIDAIQGNGPRTLEFKNVPLDGIDLSGLFGKPGIQELTLRGTNVSVSQLAPLAKMRQLEKLDIRDLVLDANFVSELIQSMPNLRQLRFDDSEYMSLKIVGHANIESVIDAEKEIYDYGGNAGVYFSVSADSQQTIHLESLPKLSDVLTIAATVNKVVLRDLPSLRGVILKGPMLPNAVVVGFRDLVEFCGGGRNLNDKIAESILRCRNLKRLALAHAQINAETLSMIGTLDQLEFLSLSGTRVNHEIVAKISNLDRLRSLNLAGTSISAESVVELGKLPALEYLTVSGLTAAAVAEIAKMKKLQILTLVAVELNTQSIQALAELPLMGELALVNCMIPDEVIASLQSHLPAQLVVLNLNGSKVSGKTLISLITAHPHLVLNLTDTATDLSATDYIIARGQGYILGKTDRNNPTAATHALLAKLSNRRIKVLWPNVVSAANYVDTTSEDEAN